MAQLYYSPISINAAQVPTTQTNFPVLVSQTDNRFKQTPTGHVANANGYDIRPYSDSGLSSALTYELERYNASTGEVVMWVKVASLSSSTTPIYLGYGDTSLITDGSDGPNTFSNNFISVYHLKDGTTLSVNDSTGSHNGTNHGVTATAGQIDGAGGFVSTSSQYVDAGTYVWPGAGSGTLSAWVNATSFPNAYNSVIVRGLSAAAGFGLFVKSNGTLACYVIVGGPTTLSYDGTGANTLSSSTPYYLVFSYDQSNQQLVGYVNGSVDKATATSGSPNSIKADSTGTDIGQDTITAGRFWNGVMDEPRISSVSRSADWITTEYNNQFAPGTFEALGAEVGATFSGLYTI